MRCQRQILGVSLPDLQRNETIRARCYHQPSVKEQIKKRRLQWFGQVCRMNTSRLPQKLLWRKRPAWRVQRVLRTLYKVRSDLTCPKVKQNGKYSIYMYLKKWYKMELIILIKKRKSRKSFPLPLSKRQEKQKLKNFIRKRQVNYTSNDNQSSLEAFIFQDIH